MQKARKSPGNKSTFMRRILSLTIYLFEAVDLSFGYHRDVVPKPTEMCAFHKRVSCWHALSNHNDELEAVIAPSLIVTT